ncbi:MAG: uracil-DNA glycosylase [Chloroflexi bacterium]|nr:MAG: uracil-DNA glycosylase [Chloroflexota bacterium]
MTIDLEAASPARVRFTGEWPLPTPRRAPPGSELRGLQDLMPACDGGARPVLSGDGSEPAMLIGQAPGRREIELGLPFAGDAGKRLVGWLGLAGVTQSDFRSRWYVTSVGKCYPGRGPGTSVDRPPSRTEIDRWTPYLLEEVRLVGPRLVVLVGGLAHRVAFGPDLRLDALVGTERCWRGAAAVCLPHPSGASTWLHAPLHQALWRTAVRQIASQWASLR